jgi:hypothetical protein
MHVESKLLFHPKEHHGCCRIQTSVRTGVLRREHLKGEFDRPGGVGLPGSF